MSSCGSRSRSNTGPGPGPENSGPGPEVRVHGPQKVARPDLDRTLDSLRSTDMQCSHAQEALNRTEYVEGTEIQDHIKVLRTRRAAVDNLSTSVMTDETWRGIIIRSIPPTQKWLPVIPSLYTMSSSADIISD